MARSEAESIYQAWNSKNNRRAVTPTARAFGAFDEHLKGGGFDIIKNRLLEYSRKKGTLKAAEQAWKLLEKFKRRQDEVVAREVMKVLQSDSTLKTMLGQFPASRFRDLSDEAREFGERLDPNNVVFPNSGKRVHIVRMLGKGGMGGAVFLAVEDTGHKYALKHFQRSEHKIPGFGGDTPRSRLDRTTSYLMRYFEAALTTTCIDSLIIGRDEFVLLELGEGSVNYTMLSIADIQSVFEDLGRLENYSRHYMKVDVTQDVSVLHLDIHGENLMRFNGKLRLIDFGMAMLYSPSQDQLVRDTAPLAYDRNNQNLYFQNDAFLEGKKAYYKQDKGNWQEYITNWQQAYRVAPEVQLCESCKRQYPPGLKISECYRCGSKKIVPSKLRRTDIEALARLNGVSPGSVGDNPYASGSVAAVTPKQYSCVVLTAVLIKEIWCAAEAGKDLGMGGTAARAIRNTEVYTKARLGQHKFTNQPQSSVIALLLLWFDEMMRRLFDQEDFGARDAFQFFGGSSASSPSRQRRHSVSF